MSEISEHEPQISLEQRIDNAFATYVAENTAYTLSMVDRGILDANKAAEMLQRRDADHRKLDFNQRISLLTNNFYLWWPNGGNRQMFNQMRGEATSEQIEFVNKLTSDIDEACALLGYESIGPLNNLPKIDKGEEKDYKLRAVATVFLSLLDKGYTVQQLRT